MTEAFYINGTKIHEVGSSVISPAGHGTIRVVEIDFGIPDQTTFLDPRPLADGQVFRGTVTAGRAFRFRVWIDGVAGRGEGFDEWETLLGLVNAENGLVSYRVTRPDAAAASVSRELLAIVTGEPAWAWVEGGGGDGIRHAGYIVASFDCVAPFPWWRDTAETTTTLSFTGTGSDNDAVVRGGHTACGLSVDVTTTGTLGQLSLGDGSRTLSMTATFSGSALGVDWYHTDPTATVIDSGVTLSIPSHVSLHSASTTLTASTADGSASGTHTVTVKHRPLWKSP